MYRESKIRSVVKSVSWRLWATLTTVGLVFLFVGKPGIAFSIGGVEVLLKMLIYFVHERAWNKINFGRHEVEPFVLWFTGLSGSGKTSVAENVSARLRKLGLKVEHLDGETIRHLFPETGFTEHDVNEHIKRVGYLAAKLEEHGVFVVASFVSPRRESREFVRNITKNFIEGYVSTPLSVCEFRDQKGLYRRARMGEIKNFPGVDAPYEVPQSPEINVDLTATTPSKAAEQVLGMMSRSL